MNGASAFIARISRFARSKNLCGKIDEILVDPRNGFSPLALQLRLLPLCDSLAHCRGAVVVVDWSGAFLEWEAAFSDLKAGIGGIFKRAGSRDIAGAFLAGLLSDVERKQADGRTGWAHRPWRMQFLLGRG